jgi:hypothetical protein
MTALCKPYVTAAEAERAVADLLTAGVPGADVRLLMGAEIHDARREARGLYAGSVAPDERVGAYGGDGPERSAPRGSFAGEPGGAEGTFANADRDVVVTHHDGEERAHVAGHAKLKALLMEAGLDEATAEADVHAIHEGRVVVLVDVGAFAEGELRAVLDGAVAAG